MRVASVRLWMVAMAAAVGVGGCRYALTTTPAFSETSGVRRIDPNHGPFTIVEPDATEPNASRVVNWKPTRIATGASDGQPYEVRTDALRFHLGGNHYVRVTMPGGRKDWALVDTGFAHYFYVNDVVVRECNLAVYPQGSNRVTRAPTGLCEIPDLRLGRAVIESPPCIYEQSHWRFTILGIPVWRGGPILLGLRFMRAHAYVRFDNPGHTVTFSPRQAFEPEDPSMWVQMPFVFEEIDQNLRMLTDLSLGDQTVRVQFDTGGAKAGLTLRQSVWDRVGHQLNARRVGSRRRRNLQLGGFRSQRYVAPALNVGPIRVSNAQIDVVPDENPTMQGFEGVLSLHYFRDTVVVLDFRENLIWIRKP